MSEEARPNQSQTRRTLQLDDGLSLGLGSVGMDLRARPTPCTLLLLILSLLGGLLCPICSFPFGLPLDLDATPRTTVLFDGKGFKFVGSYGYMCCLYCTGCVVKTCSHVVWVSFREEFKDFDACMFFWTEFFKALLLLYEWTIEMGRWSCCLCVLI